MKNSTQLELETYLVKLTAHKLTSDREDFSAYEDSGGNYDDAFEMGVSRGRKDLAKEILSTYFDKE